jgi:hypothetical protein
MSLDSKPRYRRPLPAVIRRTPPGRLSEVRVDHVFEAKLARPSGLRRAAGRRNHLAGAAATRRN